MSEVVVLLADGFEEIEGLTVVDVLRRAGISLTTASIMKREQVTGAHQIQVKADCLMEETDFSDTKMVVLPGGLGGMQNLEAHEGVRKLLRQFAKEQRYIGAICAAPTILGRMDFWKVNGQYVILLWKMVLQMQKSAMKGLWRMELS